MELPVRDNLKLAAIWGFVLFAENPGMRVSIGIAWIVTADVIATQ